MMFPSEPVEKIEGNVTFQTKQINTTQLEDILFFVCFVFAQIKTKLNLQTQNTKRKTAPKLKSIKQNERKRERGRKEERKKGRKISNMNHRKIGNGSMEKCCL